MRLHDLQTLVAQSGGDVGGCSRLAYAALPIDRDTSHVRPLFDVFNNITIISVTKVSKIVDLCY